MHLFREVCNLAKVLWCKEKKSWEATALEKFSSIVGNDHEPILWTI